MDTKSKLVAEAIAELRATAKAVDGTGTEARILKAVVKLEENCLCVAKAARDAIVLKIARQFSMNLREELSPEHLAEAIELNGNCHNTLVCHSSDHCDANMVMEPAFTKVMGREFDLLSDEDVSLWNDAWSLAKRSKFKVEGAL